jgi:sec-independent protein translocase protein TatA
LVLVVVLLFGAKRLPDAARSIGKSMKIFKAETKDLSGDRDSHADVEDVEPRQLPKSAPPAADTQIAELQRQLDELKKQQPATPVEQAQKNAS